MRVILLAAIFALSLTACVTTPDLPPGPDHTPPEKTSDITPPRDGGSAPDGEVDTPPEGPAEREDTVDGPDLPAPDPVPVYAFDEFFDGDAFMAADPLPVIAAMRQSCARFDGRDDEAFLHKREARYGRYADWREACFAVDYVADTPEAAQDFLRRFFRPVALSSTGEQGLLTGYYEPEIEVRARAEPGFTEPILGLPFKGADKLRARQDIGPAIAPVIAFGRPIDVFFMQVQGSGRLAFNDGRIIRAAFAAHNDQPYTSIGRVLIQRGEMTKDEASKQSIEAWMERAGYSEAKALMNENARYVFFRTEDIAPGEGPKGAQSAPLTAMGSIAIDPRYHPYGVPVLIETVLPQYGGDYRGAPSSLVVVTQDTGGAIKGPLRGDLFFGSGDEPGERAGVMKHQARWTLLLPIAAADRLVPGS